MRIDYEYIKINNTIIDTILIAGFFLFIILNKEVNKNEKN